jgi:hypothetical protein
MLGEKEEHMHPNVVCFVLDFKVWCFGGVGGDLFEHEMKSCGGWFPQAHLGDPLLFSFICSHSISKHIYIYI